MDASGKIKFDPSDNAGMLKLMDEYGDSENAFDGENETGERISISILPDQIVVTTFQTNNWNRINTYHRDGTTEETFDR